MSGGWRTPSGSHLESSLCLASRVVGPPLRLGQAPVAPLVTPPAAPLDGPDGPENLKAPPVLAARLKFIFTLITRFCSNITGLSETWKNQDGGSVKEMSTGRHYYYYCYFHFYFKFTATKKKLILSIEQKS